MIDYLAYNIDLVSLARKSFRPQNSDVETVLADETDYVWDPEWSHPVFIDIPNYISSQGVTTVSIKRDYVMITPLTIDATPLSYSSLFTDRTRNKSLNSAFINQEFLNGTKNLTQQDIQTPSQFVNEEIVQTMPTTTQQSISPNHLTLTTQRNKNVYSIQTKTF